ncbi:hypothetical protein L6452_35846 [Arctium lappa]|uniref:Uncharacterized protein n=1 Tax=Arctium lappa TaxID=4217 RepID=A0ACB8Y7R7_ARCLA|nr:hypothetical protein L6452_35846 [Arctium lappa]
MISLVRGKHIALGILVLNQQKEEAWTDIIYSISTIFVILYCKVVIFWSKVELLLFGVTTHLISSTMNMIRSLLLVS